MKRHISCVVIAIGWGVMSIPALAFNLSPHQAIYQMSLDGASSNSGISGAEGAMMYKFEESCEAWTSETKVYLKLLYTEGDPLETTWSFVSWEAKDGLNYRFRVHQSRNGTPVEKIQGNVSRDSINGVAEAKFTSPEGTFIDLPEGTMFPTHHLQKLIEEGEGGTLMFSRTVFDGASLDNPYKINALITAISKSAKKNTIPRSRQNPKPLGRYDAEIIGYIVA